MRLIDKSGKRFGQLVVLSQAPRRKNKVFWTCRCDCGRVVEVASSSLWDKGSKSCGCTSRMKETAPGKSCESPSKSYPNGRTGTLAGAMVHYYVGEPVCDECAEGRNREQREWHRTNEERSLDYHLRTRFHITLDRYFEILESQGGCCAICGSAEPGDKRNRRFHIDHDHNCCNGPTSCGSCVRGLLCRACNTALGNFNDDTSRLLNAVDYLNGFAATQNAAAETDEEVIVDG